MEDKKKKNQRNIAISDLCAKSIVFSKQSNPESGSEINSDMLVQYRWEVDGVNRAKVIATISFFFNPDVLFKGQIVFEADVDIQYGEITEEEKSAIIEGIEPQLASTSSFLTTVCGEAISGTKLIIPPILKEIEK